MDLIAAEISTSIICAWRRSQTVSALPRLQTEGFPNGRDCHFMLCQLNESDWYNVFAHQTRCIFQSCQTNWTGDVANVSIRATLYFSLEPWLIDSFDSRTSSIVLFIYLFSYLCLSVPVCVRDGCTQRDGWLTDIEADKKKIVEEMWNDNCNACFLSSHKGGKETDVTGVGLKPVQS